MIVSDNTYDGFRDVAVVDPSSISVSRIQRLANKLKGNSGRVFLLSVFENKDAALQTIAGKGHTDGTYSEAVARLYAAQRRSSFRMVRLVSVYGNTIIQAVDGSNISRTVVAGVDPISFAVGGKTCEILEIYFARQPRPTRADGRNPAIVKVYLKTDVLPSIAEAEAISNAIEEKFRHRNVVVHLRPDTWFLEDSEFPLWYPFDAGRTPPPLEDFRSSGEISCVANDDGRRCRKV